MWVNIRTPRDFSAQVCVPELLSSPGTQELGDLRPSTAELPFDGDDSDGHRCLLILASNDERPLPAVASYCSDFGSEWFFGECRCSVSISNLAADGTPTVPFSTMSLASIFRP